MNYKISFTLDLYNAKFIAIIFNLFFSILKNYNVILHITQIKRKVAHMSDKHNNWFDYFTRIYITGDGNCLFTSVATIITSMPDIYKEFVQQSLHRYNNEYTITMLEHPQNVRLMTVSRIYETSEDMKSIIDAWRYNFNMAVNEKNYELENDLKHVSCLSHVSIDTALTKEHLDILHYNMMKRDVYWGTEFDIIALERFLSVRFIIISNEGKVQLVPSDHPDSWTPYFFVLLYRRHLPNQMPHFQVLQWNETKQRVFFPKELPEFIVEMCKQSLPKSTTKKLPWYITMDWNSK